MRNLMIILAALAMMAAFAVAGEGHKHSQAAQEAKGVTERAEEAAWEFDTVPMNNVVQMDADGNRMALCYCGEEFQVSSDSPTIQRGGTTYYVHSQACAEKASAMSDADMKQAMAHWHERYTGYHMADNTRIENGKKMATCSCGKTFEVSKESPKVLENATVWYCHGSECHAQVVKLSADERLRMQREIRSTASR